MTTVRDLIGDALSEVGVRDPGEAVDPQVAADVLRSLNRMLDAWSTEDLLVYTIDREVFPFVPGKQNYTLGIGGDLNVARPVQIDMASALVNGVEIPIQILTDAEWRDIPLKNTPSTFPLQMWSTGNFPLNELWFWPIPSQVNSLVLYTWSQITQFANVNATVSFPKGYEDAIESNLALRVCTMFARQLPPELAARASKALSRIKRINWEPTYRSVDAALAGEGTAAEIWRRSRGYVID